MPWETDKMRRKTLTFLLVITFTLGVLSQAAIGERSWKEITEKIEKLRRLKECGKIDWLPNRITVQLEDGVVQFPIENPDPVRTTRVAMPINRMIVNYSPLDSVFQVLGVDSIRGYLRRPGDTIWVSRFGDTVIVNKTPPFYQLEFNDSIDVLHGMSLLLSLPDSIVKCADPDGLATSPDDFQSDSKSGPPQRMKPDGKAVPNDTSHGSRRKSGK
jgi:hypothetical protein